MKLVDIGPQSDCSSSKATGDAVKRDLPSLLPSDEPNAKKARPNPSESSRVLLKPKDFIDLKRRTVSSSSNSSSSNHDGGGGSRLKTIDENDAKISSDSAFDNVEEELGRLFGSGSSSPSKKDTKVTISPVRLSSAASAAPSSTSSTATFSSSAKEPVMSKMSSVPSSASVATSAPSSGGSVTITKLSTGSTLNVESKDLKTVLSASSGQSSAHPVSSSSSVTSSAAKPGENGGLKLKANIDIVSLGACAPSTKPPQLSPPEGSSIKCNKCNEEYSTKEARRLHTCNSILDQHYLSVENTAERSNTKTSSPNSPQSSSGDASNLPPTNVSSSSPPSSFDSASSRSNSPMTEPLANNASKKSSAKLIKERSDKLIIEGRPKLSVTKVPRPEINSKPPIIPKIKLPTASAQGSSAVDSSQCSIPAKVSADNIDNCATGKSAPGRSWNNESSGSGNYSGKLKIKLQPEKTASSTSGSTGATETQSASSRPSEHSGPEGGLAFSFAGKPTYSPSRVEPSNGAVPTKGKELKVIIFGKFAIFNIHSIIFITESPRDASNKDSPASQADSGVYSIASSSSPSKGDGAPTAESTSPESPNRDRMAFPEQNFNRDMQCKYTLMLRF